MKNKKTLLAIILIIICVLALVACGEVATISPYDIAIKNGFEGTEAEWLDSLKGADGQNGKDGINGLNGVDGVDGVDGKDGINGQDGKDGADGQNGVNGVDGQDGEDGKDGINGVNGQDGVDGLNGVDGENGKDGVDGTNGTDGADGKDGVNGLDGINGTDGLDGEGVFDEAKAVQEALLSSVVIKNLDDSTTGSGSIFKLNKELGEAYIVTNFHVIYSEKKGYLASSGLDVSASELTVNLYGAEYVEFAMDAEYIGGSLTNDIAVIKVTDERIKNSDVLAVKFSEEDVVAGREVFAIGNALGEGISVTRGIISVVSENIHLERSDIPNTAFETRVMRIDAPINPGNSGGGLFNKRGELVGVNSAGKLCLDENPANDIGYALPGAKVKIIIDKIMELGEGEYRISKPVLGLNVAKKDSYAKYNEETGTTEIIQVLEVDSISLLSLSFWAGLEKGDIILSVEKDDLVYGINVDYEFADILLSLDSESKFSINVKRDDTTIKIDYTIKQSNMTYID